MSSSLDHRAVLISPRSYPLLLALLLTVAMPEDARCAPSPSAGVETPAVVSATAPVQPLMAGFLNDVLGNRTRMIQVGVVFVVLGILFLMRSPK